MKYKIILLIILGLDLLNLIFQTSQISISYYEAVVLYGEPSLLQMITKASLYIFGQNDFALRLPVIFTHILSALILFDITKYYLKDTSSRLWTVFIFILLPGVLSSALVVNKAGFIIFGLLLFIWLYLKNYPKLYYPLLFIFSVSDGNFIYLFLSLSIYGIFKKDKQLFLLNVFLILICLSIYGIDAHGKPSGHFLDTLALYSAIFSPIVFIYVVFVLYRKYLDDKEDIIWFISSTGFLVSVLLSFRQEINIEYFAPYLIVALPLASKRFLNSYRVRLKEFRKTYRIMFQISLILLIANATIVVFNKELYRFIQNPQKHFVYKFHIAKELANKLKDSGINCVETEPRLQIRLKFYGVTKCDKYRLEQISESEDSFKHVTISYKNTTVYSAYVTNINK